ncbi:MAG: MmgE/PrpD family protein, partial [Xenophilus sp.]
AATLAGEGGGPATAALWGRRHGAAVRDAALVNGCAAHAHALDDTNESMRGHPSAPVVPAVLAVGEAIGADGGALLAAYAVGVEVAAKLGRTVNDRHSQLGWHTTCTLGAVGAAAACANLLRLDARRTAHALGIAASTAGGLRVNFGTMTKALHAGLAAQHGVLAAQLAQAGVTASETALEGREGFLALFGGAAAQPERGLAALAAPFELAQPGIVYKLYPTCSLMHALVDLALEARSRGLPPLERIDTIRCGISRRLEAARAAAWPASGLQAKFHVQYCVAVALLAGTQDPRDFEDAALARPGVRELAERIEIRVGADFPEGNGDFAELLLASGGEVLCHARRDKPVGHPSRPLSPAALRAKFMDHAVPVLGARQAEALHAALVRLGPDGADARSLGALLVPAG